MFGRSGCLLIAAFVVSVACLSAAQAGAEARRVPHYATEPRSIEVPVRGIFPPWRPPITPPGLFGFPQFARAAGMIFSGTVTGIERRPAIRGQSVETVAVTFHIQNAIRGAIPGQKFTIVQWMGLWASGQRYRVGEHVLLFLYPNSKLGLTSWVGGALGHFTIDPAGRALLTAQQLAAFRKDPVLGGKSRARFSDFALAVRHASEEE